MPHLIDTEVLIVGGGPVGLTLAMGLARRGVRVTLAEMRAAGEPSSSVRCNHVRARTMEIYRRLGIVHAVRNAGLPPDYPNDAAFRTTATGIEMARISDSVSRPLYRERWSRHRASFAICDEHGTKLHRSLPTTVRSHRPIRCFDFTESTVPGCRIRICGSPTVDHCTTDWG
jgi:2-polyprenyl-6-methoxyphenol hydroxylase-like FAD-dependent oxidoreductase